MPVRFDDVAPSLGVRLNRFGQPVGKDVLGWSGCALLPEAALQGSACRLEPYQADCIDALFASLSVDDGSMWTYMPFGPFSSPLNLKDNIESNCVEKGFQTFIINVDTTPLGFASFMRHDLNNGCVEVGGVTFSPALRRTRAATEAMYLMMRHAFDHGYRRYEWKCDQLNAPSNLAAQRLGFQFEGVFRNAVVYKGRRRDTAWYAVISEDWPAVRSRLEAWLGDANFDADGQQLRSLSQIGL